MTPLQMQRVQNKRLRRRKRKKSKRNAKRLTSFDVAEFEKAIANLPEQDQVLWMRFVLGSKPPKSLNAYPYETVYVLPTDTAMLRIDRWDWANSTEFNVTLTSSEWTGYQSHWLSTMDSIARAAVNGVRQYFKAVR